VKLPDKATSLDSALEAMRANRPLRAEEICRDYLLLKPGCTDHLRLLGHALMKQRRLPEAEAQLRLALNIDPDMPQLHEDVGSVLFQQARYEEAVPFFEQAIRLDPGLPRPHKKLGEALAALGRGAEADRSFAEFLDRDPAKGAVAAGAEHLRAGRLNAGIEALTEALAQDPDNVDALYFLAAAYWREQTQVSDAEALLRRATRLAPAHLAAWMMLGAVLLEQVKHLEAVDCYAQATRLDPDNAAAWAGLGNAYAMASYADESAAAFARSIALNPDAPNVQMGYAHVLKTLGDQPGALAAYRAAINAQPSFGEVYWSMANLKVFEFEPAEVEAMEAQLQREGLSESADIHFRFALGKAYEDRGDYDRAWHYYHTGNERQRMQVSFGAVEMEERHREIVEIFSKAFIDAHAGHGCAAADPILIVGLPRSGSTLIEQILASHSQVEGTSELPTLGKLAASIGRYRPDGVGYPKAALALRDKDWRAYGQRYMEETRRHRLTDKPRFTDKLPNNFAHVGLLHLILPNARVINARRHPLDSCLGCYKQLFGKGQHFTYDMEDLSVYYREYHALMQHWRAVLPGKVLDVHYEETVSDLETQVRRILAHCGLPFEPACVRFHETERAVKTASSEQVRQPIYTRALGKWRNYEKHIRLWIEDLEEIIDELPAVVRDAGR
jgi:tetratricopeptide (TPR) repeat protein